ncbi:hypothetical protein FPZ42_07190 [Mucilaginibacter achroorhodeus]|uniref:Uncharacterized protein n=1 Tax=Mucilaginibacter achroorhodeus TaxID=2599294 RepID=A0A563U656_9SPHI|nr:hypothetical protein [Mucilaginibacter achroorhodeus]TWR26815.1 hypothetical protein FPZ42_07190 [Mucilaginibacter achroorhodeus]
MSDYKVQLSAEGTMIENFSRPFKMRVRKNVKLTEDCSTAVLEAAVYKEDGTFVQTCSYLFEALDSQDKPVSEVSLDEFNNAVDFFFTSLLDTEYYIKRTPRASSLCHPAMKAFKFD